MIETAGLAILLGWLIFAALLCLLAFFVLRRPADPVSKPGRQDQP